jgi:pimeloyl-[acyl-carrier protein] methyl ester esterase
VSVVAHSRGVPRRAALHVSAKAVATIVLLPGMDGSGTLFAEFIAALPRSTKAVVVAYPPDQALGYEELEAIARKKLPTGPFVLLGESFSGPVALALAAGDPPGLRGVVLVCSFARYPLRAPGLLRALVARLPVWRTPAYLAGIVLLGRDLPQPHLRRLSAAMTAVTPEAWRARLRAVLTVDLSGRLSAVKVPLLYLMAKSDRLVPRSAWELIRKSLPSAQHVELDGPHFLLQAKAVESAAHVEAFAREIGVAL